MKRLLLQGIYLLFCLFFAAAALAEGSKDMFPAGATGNRALMFSSATRTNINIGNIYNPGRMFVYAKVGEVIYAGSSVQGMKNGNIRLVAPNGTPYSSGASTTIGRIDSRSQELAGPAPLAVGGYTPFIRTVGSGEEGVWTIDFISATPDDPQGSGTGFSPFDANENWTSSQQSGFLANYQYILAWDVTVASAGSAVPGRAYMNVFTGSVGNASASFRSKFKVLTKDGFQYDVGANGIQPWFFTFFVNNKGTKIRSTDLPAYESITNNEAVSTNGTYTFHDPTKPDGATDFTHKMYFNPIDTRMPANAPIYQNGVTASTWLFSQPQNPQVTNVTFNGREGTPNSSGAPPLNGGTLRFTANQSGIAKISIDVNNNGSFNDPVDRIINTNAVIGQNAVSWDGKDGNGNDVANNSKIKLSVILYSGEVHFPYLDVENNLNGINVTRTNGTASPSSNVYWDDKRLSSHSGGPTPITNTASPGINSLTNGHKFTNDYGDVQFIDTWTYIFSDPIELNLTVTQRQADLAVPSLDGPAAICPGSSVTYSTTVRNNGPDDADGATYYFNWPAELTNVKYSYVTTAGSSVVSENLSNGQLTAKVNLKNGGEIRFTFVGDVNTVPAGGTLNVRSAVLRPADVTDPDATNGASTSPPTDPDVECNAAPSGQGCNNIKTSSTTVSAPVSTNQIQADQSICRGANASPLTGDDAGSAVTYLWQFSTTSNSAGFSAAAGTNNAKDYILPSAPDTSTWYRRVVNSGACTDTSKTVLIKVNPVLQPGIVGDDQAFCTSGDPAAFKEKKPASGGSGSYTYHWQSSTDNISFTNIADATSATYDAPAVSQTTYYRRIVSSAGSGCSDAVSDTIKVQIDTAPTVSNAGEDQQLCNVTATTLNGNTPSSGKGTWHVSSGPNTPVIADSTNPATDVSGMVPGTYTFVWAISNGVCPVSTDTVKVVVSPLPTTANAGADQELCNASSTKMDANAPSAGTGEWKEVTGPAGAVFANAADAKTQVTGLQAGVYQFTWTITSGNCPASTDTVQVTIHASPTKADAGPDQTQYNSGDFTMKGNNPENGTGKWTVMDGNASVQNAADPNTVVTLQPNTSATLTWTISNGNCPASSDTVVLTYSRKADLKITKSGAGNSYKTGSDLSYTITIENLGPADVAGASIQDALPDAMENASWTSSVTGAGVILDPASGSGKTIDAKATIPFASGNKIVLTVTGKVADAAKGGTVIQNQAKITPPADITDPDNSNNSSTVTGTVPNNPPVAVDDQYTTKRDVPVSGNVLDNDSDPENQPLKVNTNPVTAPAHGKLTLNADGSFTYTPEPGFTGTDSFVYQVCDSEGACSQATATIDVQPAEVDLAVNKTADPASAIAGNALSYTIKVTNNGPSTIHASETFTVTDQLPQGFVADTYTPSAGSFTPGSGNWTGVKLALGQQVNLVIKGHVAPDYTGDQLTNTVNVAPPPGVTDPTPATSTVETPVTRAVEIVVAKTDNSDVYTPGAPVTYTLTYTNKGPSDVAGLRVTDTLPAGITQASWTYNFSDGAQGSGSGTGAIDTTIHLPAGAKVSYMLTMDVPSDYSGTLKNTATATVPQGYTNINPAANTATDTDKEQRKYKINITKDGPASAVAGDSITYHLLISNEGPSDLKDATIHDQLPAGVLQPVWTVTAAGTAQPSVTNGNGDVNFTASLPAGTGNNLTVTIKGIVDKAATGSFSNVANITPPGEAPVASNKVNTTIQNKTGITVVKESTPAGKVNAGEPIQYKIHVTNAGPSNATGVSIKDVVPAAILQTAWSASASGDAHITGTASGSGNNISTTADIPAGQGNEIVITVDGTVDPAATDAVVNTATATPAGGSPVSGTNETTVENKPGLQIVKTGPSKADAGTELSYTITITNNGPSDAVNATITDAVPGQITGTTWTATAAGKAAIVSGASGTGNNVQLTGNIPAGANNSIVVQAKGILAPDASGTISNAANVHTDNGSPVTSDTVNTTVNNNPGLFINKSGPANAAAGEQITYEINVGNNGPSDAFNVVVTDTVPAMLHDSAVKVQAYGKVTIASASITNGVLHVTGNFPAGDSNHAVILLSGTIDPAFTGTIYNQAVVTADGATPVSSEQVHTNVTSKPSLTLTKSAPDTAAAGSRISYVLQLTNTGLSDATNVSVNDQISNQLTNVSWTATAAGRAAVTSGATGSGNQLTVGANVPTGADNVIRITITGTLQPSASGTITNVATAQAPGTPRVSSDTVSTVIQNKPGLQISKTGPEQVAAGEEIVYTITVTNSGPSDAVNATISDTLDAALQNISWTAAASGKGTSVNTTQGTGNIINLTGNIPAGDGNQVQLTIKGRLRPDYSGSSLVNTATATAPGSPAVSSAVTSEVKHKTDLQIVKSGPANAVAGDAVTYTITVTNNGPSDARTVAINDELPAAISDASWSATANGTGASVSTSSGTGNIAITADIPAGTASIEIVINGRIKPGTQESAVVNTATATPAPGDTDNSPAASSVNTHITRSADLAIVKSGPANRAAGQDITWTLTVTNRGVSDANGAVIKDAIPGFVSISSIITSTRGNAKAYAPITAGNNLQLTADIAAGTGNAVIVTISGHINSSATGTMANTATIEAPAGTTDPNTANNTSTINTGIATDVGIQLSKSGPATVNVGDSITYNISISNNGVSDANNVLITDAVPADITGVTWTAAAIGRADVSASSGSGNHISLIGDLGASSSGEILIAIKGLVSANAANTIVNTATAEHDGNKISQVVTSVNKSANLRISKAGPAAMAAGQAITYVVKVNNAGPADVTGATITDAVPAGINNISWKAIASNGASVSPAEGTGGNISLLADLHANTDTITVVVRGVVASDFKGTLVNTATATPPAGVTNPVPATATVSTQVNSEPGLVVVKSGPEQVTAGNAITYTLLATNNGPSDAGNISLTDLVPSAVSNVQWTASASGATINSGSNGTGNAISVTGSIQVGGSILVNITGTIAAGASGTIVNAASLANDNKEVSRDSVKTKVTSHPGLLVNKSGPRRVAAGDVITYSIDITNAGPSDLSNALIKDAVPAMIGGVSWSISTQGNASLAAGTPSNGTGNLVSFHGNIPVGDNNSIHIIVTGTTHPDSAGTITNTAIATDQNGQSYTGSVTTAVDREAPLSVVKSGPAAVNAGESISYLVTVSNSGPSNANGVTITDGVPAVISNVKWQAVAKGKASITGASTGTGNAVMLTGNIAGGNNNSIQLIITGTIPSNTTAASITNLAVVKDAAGDTTSSAPVQTLIQRKAKISVVKEGPATAHAGDSIHYLVTVTNAGPSNATGITISDQLPDAITGVSWTATATGAAQVISNATGTGNNLVLQADIPAGKANTIVVGINGRIAAGFTGTLSNTAGVVKGKDHIASNTVQTTVTAGNRPKADLSVTKSGPAGAAYGDRISYLIVAQNNGPSAADGALITDILPASLHNINGSIAGVTNGAVARVDISGNEARITARRLPAGATVRIIISGTVSSIETLHNTAVIAPPAGVEDPDTGNNTSADITTIIEAADLEISKQLVRSTSFTVGGKVDFSIAVKNNGPSVAKAVVVRDTLRGNLEPEGDFSYSTGRVHYDPATRILTWNIDSLLLSQTVTLGYTTRITGTGVVVNAAAVTSATPDPSMDNNMAVTPEKPVTGDDIFIPNVITPNGDGKNDRLVIVGLNHYPGSSLAIYNRWGNQVYHAENYQNNWDGNGLSGGTYYYIFKLKTQNGIRLYKGWIELFK